MASIKDVAKHANVGIATVSRVLNNSGFVSAETRQIVLSAIEDLDYVPNELARNFQKRQTNFIGIIVPSIRQKFTTELLSQLEKDLSDLGYFLLLFVSNHDEQKEIEYLEKLKSQQVVGTIITAPFISNDNSYSFQSLPIVSFDRFINDEIPCVHVDNYQAGFDITEKLVSKTVKKLCFVGFGADPKSLSQERISGFVDACNKYNREYKICNIDQKDNDREVLSQLYQSIDEYDGFFFGCDYHAHIFINIDMVAKNLIGNSLFVVGFDGLSDNDIFYPILTTVSQPVEKISEALIEALMKQINKETVIEKNIIVPYQIISGESC